MITVLVAVLTLGSCAAIHRYLRQADGQEHGSAGEHICLTTLWNEGAAFDLPIPRTVVTVLSGAGLTVLWFYRRISPVGAGLVLGGGVSNFWERLRHGKVFDYVRFPKAPGRLKHYVFNLADFAIFAGALILLLRKWNGRRF